MSGDWGSLPLLPLRNILEYLSLEDALAATSTCRHWRSAVFFYDAHKEQLKLEVKDLEKNMFLARLFRKHTRRLHVYIDTAGPEFNTFTYYVLPLFFDTLKLNELAFLGPSYICNDSEVVPVVKLKRIIIESLIFKHLQSLQRFTLIGCEMGTPKNTNDRFKHKQVEYYSRPLSFSTERSLGDTVLSKCNVGLMTYSKLQSITMDFGLLSSETLATLAQLPELSHLTLNIGHKRPLGLSHLEWPAKRISVAINIIAVPVRHFNKMIKYVFVSGLFLVSLKVMFCKSFHVPLLNHVSRHYSTTLQELVWVDAPAKCTASYYRVVKPEPYDVCVNHILLLCWQCRDLKRLVVHGYWLWQYDVLGIVRLRSSLEHLEVSAVYDHQSHFGNGDNSILRVFASDNLPLLETEYVKKINEHTDFKWSQCTYENLHPALKIDASAMDRANYIMNEATRSPIL